DRDDLVDDVADFLARRVGVEPSELGEIDRFDQGAEDRALGLVVALRTSCVGGELRRGGPLRRGRRRNQRRSKTGGWKRRSPRVRPALRGGWRRGRRKRR